MLPSPRRRPASPVGALALSSSLRTPEPPRISCALRTSSCFPGPWQFAQRSFTVVPIAACVVAKEAPPVLTMCDFTSALSWHAEQTAAVGLTFHNPGPAGFTAMFSMLY